MSTCALDSIAETFVWGGWALDRATALDLAAHYRRAQPRVIVEAGSGYSTVIAAEYARDTGAIILSLDHQREYASRTRSLLRSAGLDRYVTVQHAPLVTIGTPAGDALWYGADLPDDIDFALIDGPPGTIGRRGALYGLYPHLGRGWQVWLDDADRDGEQAALSEWATHLPRLTVRRVALPRGLAIVTDRPAERTPAPDLVITVLTGRRPTHLADTIQSLEDTAPGVLDSAHVMVCHNGQDEATRRLIETMPFVDDYFTVGGPGLVPIGDAMGEIYRRLVACQRAEGGRRLWLHLEDDWRAATTAPGRWWLDEARRVLDGRSEVGQVRLRHRCESVHVRNIRTGLPIHWRPSETNPNMLFSDKAHYTCNPSIMRLDDSGRVWPAAGEGEAIDRFATSGLLVAQLSPGVFHHTGADESLRIPVPRRARPRTRQQPRRGRPGMATQAPGTPATPRTAIDYSRFYRSGGWTYDLVAEERVMRMIAGLAGWTPGAVVHEIGAGRGDHAGILAGLGMTVTAVERAESGTAATLAAYPQVDAVNADVAEWTPDVRGHVFARGMSWFHWELDGVNSNGVDVPAQTRGLVHRALSADGVFVLQIWSDLSGRRPPNKIHNNTLADYHGLFDPLFSAVSIYDWSGNKIINGQRHDRGVIVVATGQR